MGNNLKIFFVLLSLIFLIIRSAISETSRFAQPIIFSVSTILKLQISRKSSVSRYSEASYPQRVSSIYATLFFRSPLKYTSVLIVVNLSPFGRVNRSVIDCFGSVIHDNNMITNNKESVQCANLKIAPAIRKPTVPIILQASFS